MRVTGDFRWASLIEWYMTFQAIGSSKPMRSWRFIWSPKAPPKVLMFAWRCAREALPTSTSLCKPGVNLTEGCFGCLADQEDVLHVLFSCPFKRLVWQFPAYHGGLLILGLVVLRSGSGTCIINSEGLISIFFYLFVGRFGGLEIREFLKD
ncbi:UNVERIFIED_CONTAM: hypothetical protein Sradi_3787900 [Sesamum radiatum]|uniref:Reverse transcriptase zinc-binding domain-containing protein n=1 Tax=Sesamum radiatum TaxID=300843 RepID=A0AAW2PZN2_SESRA